MIVPLRREHAARVAAIHRVALAGDFLPSLGQRFLETYYRAALDLGVAHGFVEIIDDQITGFVLGALDTSRMFGTVVRRRAFALAWCAMPVVLRHPALLRNVLETFLYPGKENLVPERAELVVIACDAGHRRRGTGRALVGALEKFFGSRGTPSFKVTVLEANTNAGRFYDALGFQRRGRFDLYRKGWLLLTKELPRAGDTSAGAGGA